MKKKIAEPKEVRPKGKVPPVTFTAYTVCKSRPSANSAQAFEVKVVDGIVTEIKEISRAPDLPVSIIARTVDYLWGCFRTQYTKDLVADEVQAS